MNLKKIHLCGKTMENVRSLVKIKFLKKECKKMNKQQSELTFIGIQKTYTNYDSYTFIQNEIFMDKPNYIGYAVSQINKLQMYEIY